MVIQHARSERTSPNTPSPIAAANTSGNQIVSPTFDKYGYPPQYDFYPTAYAKRWMNDNVPAVNLPESGGSVTFNIDGDVYIARVVAGVAVDVTRKPKADCGGGRIPPKRPVATSAASAGGDNGDGLRRWAAMVTGALVAGLMLSVALFVAGCGR